MGCVCEDVAAWNTEIVLPMFSSRTFMVLYLIFQSFIHLELIFVYGVSWWSSFIFLHIAVQISQHHFFKRLFWLHFMLLPPSSNINWPVKTWVYFWALCSVPLIYVPVFMPVPGYFDYNGLVIQFDMRYCDPSCFVLLSQNSCSYSGSFMVPYKFLKCCSISEICHGYSNRDCIESINRFG